MYVWAATPLHTTAYVDAVHHVAHQDQSLQRHQNLLYNIATMAFCDTFCFLGSMSSSWACLSHCVSSLLARAFLAAAALWLCACWHVSLSPQAMSRALNGQATVIAGLGAKGSRGGRPAQCEPVQRGSGGQAGAHLQWGHEAAPECGHQPHGQPCCCLPG